MRLKIEIRRPGSIMCILAVLHVLAATSAISQTQPENDPSIRELDALLKDAERFPAEEAKDKIFAATRSGDTAFVRAWLDRGNDPDTSLMGSTLLILAASHGRVEVMKRLVAAGAKVNARNISGATALFAASRSSNAADAVKMLIRAGGMSRHAIKVALRPLCVT